MSSGIGALGETGGIGTNADGSTFAEQNNFGKSSWFKATMITSAGLSGGLSSSIAGGSFWAGARQGVIVATMNHLAHMGFDKSGENLEDVDDIDPKKIAKSIKDNPDKVVEVAEVGVSVKQLQMIESRRLLAINDRIGSYRNFAGKYEKLGKIGGALGKVNNVFTAVSTVSDYNDPQVSTERFAYRTTGTVASIGTAAVVGSELGGPYGTVAGSVIGAFSAVGEMTYDAWNNTILPQFKQFENALNNGWRPSR